jgi:uncharacterized membrane protein YfcA
VTPGQLVALVASSSAAGVMNSMAGGGTILTFPALIFLGVPSVQANATSTVALLPGAATSMAAYRQEVGEHREWLKTLVVPSVLGGSLGAVLLLRTPERIFSRLAPYLILFATLLFLFQAVRSPRQIAGPLEGSSRRMRWAFFFQLLVSIYGGYFGAGIGILMLVTLGFLGLTNIHAMNGLKNFFGMCINGVAAGYFIWKGAVVWPYALIMLVGAAVGGYAGARFARRIGQKKARAAVVVIGFLISAALLIEQA